MKKAWYAYDRRKTAENIDNAYSDYLFWLQNGISQPADLPDEWVEENRQEYKDHLVEGRLLNGKALDLDF